MRLTSVTNLIQVPILGVSEATVLMPSLLIPITPCEFPERTNDCQAFF